jgi:hypothetical protein
MAAVRKLELYDPAENNLAVVANGGLEEVIES